MSAQQAVCEMREILESGALRSDDRAARKTAERAYSRLTDTLLSHAVPEVITCLESIKDAPAVDAILTRYVDNLMLTECHLDTESVGRIVALANNWLVVDILIRRLQVDELSSVRLEKAKSRLIDRSAYTRLV